MLCGCTTWGPTVAPSTEADWIEYGNSVRAFDASELERQYAAITREHATMPSSQTAIKLALLVTDSRAYFFDPDRAIGLLDGVVSNDAGDDASVEFAVFMRSLISQLSATEAALAAEREQRQALRDQLDALKALEERLNADELER